MFRRSSMKKLSVWILFFGILVWRILLLSFYRKKNSLYWRILFLRAASFQSLGSLEKIVWTQKVTNLNQPHDNFGLSKPENAKKFKDLTIRKLSTDRQPSTETLNETIDFREQWYSLQKNFKTIRPFCHFRQIRTLKKYTNLMLLTTGAILQVWSCVWKTGSWNPWRKLSLNCLAFLSSRVPSMTQKRTLLTNFHPMM